MMNWLLTLSAALIFLGRGILYYFYDAPVRAILWNEEVMGPFISFFGLTSWTEYAIHSSTDAFCQKASLAVSLLFLLSSVFILFQKKWHSQKMMIIPFISWLILTVFVGLSWQSKDLMAAQLIEHGIQILVPFLWMVAHCRQLKMSGQALTVFLKVATSLTFIGHGLYALNIYPTPGPFIDMVIEILGVNENQARFILKIMGSLDVICSIGIWFRRFLMPSLIFMIPWGMATSLARPLSHPQVFEQVDTFLRWMPELIFRLPHGLVPLIIWYAAGHIKSRKLAGNKLVSHHG